MTNEARLAELRELFLSARETEGLQSFALAASIALVAIVLWLVRRRSLQEEYTPIWMAVALVLLIASMNLDWLHRLTVAIGAWTLSSTVFFLGEIFLLAICLNYAVRLSRAGLHIKNLAQQVTLLQARVERLETEASAGGD